MRARQSGLVLHRQPRHRGHDENVESDSGGAGDPRSAPAPSTNVWAALASHTLLPFSVNNASIERNVHPDFL